MADARAMRMVPPIVEIVLTLPGVHIVLDMRQSETRLGSGQADGRSTISDCPCPV